MKNNDSYIRNKIQNMFTAYLVKSVEGAVKDYIDRKNKINVHEELSLEMNKAKFLPRFEDLIAVYEKEAQEKSGDPNMFFGRLENDRLLRAVMLLSEQQRDIIYQHVFEEKTFREISIRSGEPEHVLKNRYYYALRKIRKRMEGEDTNAV